MASWPPPMITCSRIGLSAAAFTGRSGRGVEQLRARVVGGRDQQGLVDAELHVHDPVLVDVELVQLVAVLSIEDAQRAVVVRNEDLLVVVQPRNLRRAHLGRDLEHAVLDGQLVVLLRVAWAVVHGDLSGMLSEWLGRRREVLAALRPRHGPHRPAVVILAQFTASAHLPQPHRRVRGSGQQPA
eukprot:scaffold98_cov244-Pinguiococcus_pyrenoidosus.AAC.6